MADADWLAAAQSPASQPATIVHLIVNETVGPGTVTFKFITRGSSRDIAKRLGIDLLTTLVSTIGASTKINPDFFTDRGVRTLSFLDEEDGEAFDGATTAVTTGGSFWRRLVVSYPAFFGSVVRVFSTFNDPAITSESQNELVFEGLMENIKFTPDDRVHVRVRDRLTFRDRKIPAPTGTDNQLTVAISAATDSSFTPTDTDEYTDPLADWPSQDFPPPAVLINSERILYQEVSGSTLVVARNRLTKSEAFTDAAWTKAGGATVSDDVANGPFGIVNGAQISLPAGATLTQASPTLTSASQPANVSIWIRPDDATSVSLSLKIQGSAAALETATNSITTLAERWVRFDIGKTFTAGAGGTVEWELENTGGSAVSIFIAQAAVVPTATKRVYAASDTTEGDDLGRGAFGTTATTHSIGDRVREVAVYLDQLSTFTAGYHPVFLLRDFVNRALIPVASVDEAAFSSEIDFAGSIQFRRTIDDPRTIKELTKEVRGQGLIGLWATNEGTVKVRLDWRRADPNEAEEQVDETEDIVMQSQILDLNKDSRITRVFIYFDLKTIGGEPADGDKPEDFSSIIVNLDEDAEEKDGEAERSIFIFSRWIFREAEALSLGGRLISRFRLGARKLKLQVGFHRFDDIKTGDVIRVQSQYLLEDGGSGAAVQASPPFQVTSLGWPKIGQPMDLDALETTGRRICFIGPNTLPADFDLATEEEKRFCWIGDASNLVGTPAEEGYFIL